MSCSVLTLSTKTGWTLPFFNCPDVSDKPPDSGERHYHSTTWKRRFDPALRASEALLDAVLRGVSSPRTYRKDTYIHIYKYICIYDYFYIHVYTYIEKIHIYIYTYIHIYIYQYIYIYNIHIYIYMNRLPKPCWTLCCEEYSRPQPPGRIHIYIYVCMCIYMLIYIYIYIYVIKICIYI